MIEIAYLYMFPRDALIDSGVMETAIVSQNLANCINDISNYISDINIGYSFIYVMVTR